ncbi:MAG: spore photoproduct lyase family protein [Paenisporosarcina sp.]
MVILHLFDAFIKKAIEHISQTELGMVRFVTKFHFVDHLLNAHHNSITSYKWNKYGICKLCLSK